jgi:outer membrane lipoprotein SlyB
MKFFICILSGAALPLCLVSCFPKELTGDTYSRNEAGQVQTVRSGTVQSVRMVKLQAGQGAGSTIGAIAGGIAGSKVGGGSGQTLGALGGAAAGAVAGGAIEQKIGNKQGIEMTISLDDGETISIVQEHTERESFNPGDRVRVLYGSGRTRVAH